jgi:hypothetical protein
VVHSVKERLLQVLVHVPSKIIYIRMHPAREIGEGAVFTNWGGVQSYYTIINLRPARAQIKR